MKKILNDTKKIELHCNDNGNVVYNDKIKLYEKFTVKTVDESTSERKVS